MTLLKPLLTAASIICIATALIGQPATAQQPQMSRIPAKKMSAAEAYKKSLAKQIILIDIRDPSEWAETGVPATATPLTMHQKGAAFLAGLNKLSLDKSKPIAVICATGSRSAYLQKVLVRFGYPNIIDVAEGMLGNPKDGPGWLKAGLPIKQVKKPVKQ